MFKELSQIVLSHMAGEAIHFFKTTNDYIVISTFSKGFSAELFQCQGILIGSIDRYIHGFFIK